MIGGTQREARTMWGGARRRLRQVLSRPGACLARAASGLAAVSPARGGPGADRAELGLFSFFIFLKNQNFKNICPF